MMLSQASYIYKAQVLNDAKPCLIYLQGYLVVGCLLDKCLKK